MLSTWADSTWAPTPLRRRASSAASAPRAPTRPAKWSGKDIAVPTGVGQSAKFHR